MAASTDAHSASQSSSECITSSMSSVDDEIGTDPAEKKDTLVELLSGLKTSGSFATSDKISGDIVTGFSVHNVGRIGFPLSAHQAKEIIGACHPAPFGKSNQTIVDESVRRTWELNPDQLTLDGPTWSSKIDKIAHQAARDLGCPLEVKVRANLYKLLLYQNGALFKPHKDTEKQPGMFATLAIALPSEYEGGEIVTTHRKKSKVLRADHPTFFHNYMAWYADVTHEVKPIASEYRLVLVYNLVNDSSEPSPSASLAVRKKQELGQILSSWSKAANEGKEKIPARLIYQLDHQYTDVSLNLEALKGLDKVRVEHLHETCPCSNVCLYLASMERSETGGCVEFGGPTMKDYPGYRKPGAPTKYHVIEDTMEDSLSLKRIIDLQGNVLTEDVDIKRTDLAQDDPFGRDPDDEEYEGYTGNAGASAIHWYHDTVLVSVPLSNRAKFLGDSAHYGLVNVDPWLDRLVEKVEASVDNSFVHCDLSDLAYSSLGIPKKFRTSARGPPGWKEAKFAGPQTSSLFRASMCLKDKQLFIKIIERGSVMTLPDFHDMGRAVLSLDIDSELIKTTVQDTQYMNRIERVFEEMKNFHERYHALQHFIIPFEHTSESKTARWKRMQEWSLVQYKSAIECLQDPTREAGICLAALTSQRPEVVTLPNSCSWAKGFENNIAFLISFASELVRLKARSRISEPIADESFSEVLQRILPTFRVECRGSAKRSQPGSGAQPATCLMDGEDMAILLREMTLKGLKDSIGTLVLRLSSKGGNCEVVAFESFYIPLLKNSMQSKVPRADLVSTYSLMFRRVLNSYLDRYVQARPSTSTTWARDPAGCGYCRECGILDRFLEDPEAKSKGFEVNNTTRCHLYRRLSKSGHTHVTNRARDRRGRLGYDTLIVTKSIGGSDTKCVDWDKRQNKAQEQVTKLTHENPGLLNELLGEEYETLIKDSKPQLLSNSPLPPKQCGPLLIDLIL